MKIEAVAKRLADIRAEADDDESAHGDEDRLWCDVLKYIATGNCPDPQAYAIVALQTTKIDFHRWCA